MKRITFLSIFLITLTLSINAQEIQYASKLINFSSEYTTKKYSARQILGEPAIFPENTFKGNTWAAAGTAKNAFIKIGFEKPMPVEQIVVYEFCRANTISHIYAYDQNDKEYLVYENKPKDIAINKRSLSIIIPRTAFNVTALKIVCDFTNHKNLQTHIDAVAISDSPNPIPEPSINLAKDYTLKSRPERMGESINSMCDELVPMLSSDGNSMFFIRSNCETNMEGKLDKHGDIYFSIKKEGEWLPAQNIGKPINNKENNAAFAVSPDGNSLLLKGSYEKGNYNPKGGLSLSYKTKNGWSVPKLMDIKNYYTQTDVINFFLADDWKTLILAIERDDSYGEADLYVSFRTGENTWSEPKNLGYRINSSSLDFSPYLAPDGKTLYFASYVHPGYGYCDMFVSKRLDDTWQNWSKPVNLGPHINTSGFDAYYRVTANGKQAYYVSGNGSYAGDIYMVELPEELKPEPVVLISGKVLNAKTKEVVEASIFYENLNTNVEMGQTISSPVDGYYSIVMPYGNLVGFRANAKGYVATNENIDLTQIDKYKVINKDIYLYPIEIGQIVKLNNIFFEFGKSGLLKESYPELDRLVNLLNDNPKMKIELLGHTDNVGSDASNLTLSNNRVNSVRDYIVSKGIDTNRITGKGYGASSPFVANDTDENRQLNRRVEMKILNL